MVLVGVTIVPGSIQNGPVPHREKKAMHILKTYFATMIAFLAIDSVWLGVIAPDFYAQHIGHLMAEDVNFTAAAFFYLMYIAGIVKFAILPNVTASSWKAAATNGAWFGVLAYATYDLTNYATLRDWPFIVVGVDIVWGGFITSVAGVLGYMAHKKFTKA